MYFLKISQCTNFQLTKIESNFEKVLSKNIENAEYKKIVYRDTRTRRFRSVCHGGIKGFYDAFYWRTFYLGGKVFYGSRRDLISDTRDSGIPGRDSLAGIAIYIIFERYFIRYAYNIHFLIQTIVRFRPTCVCTSIWKFSKGRYENVYNKRRCFWKMTFFGFL